jgi:hypothetical protein
MVLSRKSRAQEVESANVLMDGEQIVRSRTVKCLGVWIDDKLMWKDHDNAVRKKCCAGLAKLRSLRDVLPPEIKKKLYCILVLPHLDYCSVVWMECAKTLQQKLERI